MMVTCTKRETSGEVKKSSKRMFEITVPDLTDKKRRKFSVEPAKKSKKVNLVKHDNLESSTIETISVESAKKSKKVDLEKPESSTVETTKAKKDEADLKMTVVLRKPILEFIQFKTWTLETLIERTYEEFLHRYFPDEIVTIQANNTIRRGRVIESIASTETKIDPEVDSLSSTPKSSYFVNLITGKAEDAKIVVQEDEMSRSRFNFSKNAIRQLINTAASRCRDLKDFPWVVQPKFCKRYQISLRIPNELKRSNKQDEEKSKDSDKPTLQPVIIPPEVKYPIEDLELPQSAISTPPPKSTCDLPISNELMGDVLAIWSFFNTFGKPLYISPFSLEEFLDALHHRVEDPCTLMTECYVALLNAVITSKTETTRTTESEEQPDQEMTVEEDVDWMFEKKGRSWDSSLIPFNRNHWELCLLCFVQSKREMLKFSMDILNHIRPSDTSDTSNIKNQFSTLETKYKVDILNCLLENVLDTETIRQYIQECLEAHSETRKEFHETKRELSKIRTSIADYIKVDKLLLESNQDAEEEKIEDNESTSKPRSKLREEARVKEQESKARTDERKRLGEYEMKLDRKLAKLSTEMDKYLVLRSESLGYDRFFNCYHLFGRVAYNGGWISDGKIYVCSGAESQLKYVKEKVGDHDIQVPQKPNQWYCIEEEQIQELINWLNPKGNRESELQQSLEKNLEKVLGSVKKRAQ
ncbi:hypothetical protein K7432_013212, partial [Basidiobolus ranarum]